MNIDEIEDSKARIYAEQDDTAVEGLTSEDLIAKITGKKTDKISKSEYIAGMETLMAGGQVPLEKSSSAVIDETSMQPAIIAPSQSNPTATVNLNNSTANPPK